MEPTWIFQKMGDRYHLFSPDQQVMWEALAKSEVEQKILYRGTLAELDLDQVPRTRIKVNIHDGMIKYFMVQALSEKLREALGTNQVVTCEAKIIYMADGIANIENEDLVLYQEVYPAGMESEAIQIMWSNTMKGIINNIRKQYPSTSMTTEQICRVLGVLGRMDAKC